MKIRGKIAEGPLKDEHNASHHKIARIWIIVADQRIARIFRRTGKDLELIGEASPARTQRQKGIPNSSMGRVVSFSGARHKLEPSAEPGKRDAVNFAHKLSLWLEYAVQNDLFDRLVLIAAPKTLGDLRQHLSKAVQVRITAEVSKELTKLNEKELLEELKELVWF